MGNDQKIVYLDHAATTPTDPRVVEAMLPYFSELYGNPSSQHSLGRDAREAVEDARARVAALLKCRHDEVIFVGSGTESDNLAIFGSVHAAQNPKKAHFITTAIEHHAVLTPAEELHEHGFPVTILPVDEHGLVSVEAVRAAIKPETVLVSVMYANNEVGTIEPVAEIGAMLKEVNTERKKDNLQSVRFHTDACQAGGVLDIGVDHLGVDLLTLNGSKIYGPKGVGVLYIRKGTPIKPFVCGGGQEFGIRAGTENVPGITGFVKALELVQEKREEENTRLFELRNHLIKKILEMIPGARLNGHPEKRLPNNVHVSFKSVDGVAALLLLDEQGVKVGTRSACSEKQGGSSVLAALKVPREFMDGSLRFTLGKSTTQADVELVLKALSEIISQLRSTSAFEVS